MFLRTYASSRVKRKSCYRKTELHMFLLISDGHKTQGAGELFVTLIVLKFYSWYHASPLFLYCKIEQTVIRSTYKPGNILANALEHRWR